MAIPPMLVGDTQYRGEPIFPDDSNSQEYSDLVFGAAPPAAPAPAVAPAPAYMAPSPEPIVSTVSGIENTDQSPPESFSFDVPSWVTDPEQIARADIIRRLAGGEKIAGWEWFPEQTRYIPGDSEITELVPASAFYQGREFRPGGFEIKQSGFEKLLGGIAPLVLSSIVPGAGLGFQFLNAGRAAIEGDPTKALVGAAMPYIGQQLSPYIGQLGSEASKLVGGDTLGRIASDAVTGAAKSGIGALLSGESVSGALGSGALGGAAGAGIGMVGDETRELLGGLPKPIQDAAVAAVTSGLAGRDPLQAALRAGFGSAATKSNFTYPGTEGATDDLIEGFFEPGGEGFVPTLELSPEEVQRETNSLLARYPKPGVSSDLFLGENVASGIPDWDLAADKVGLPIGNLEQDFSVNERGQIVDSAGNVGAFVGDTFVPETGITPDRTDYTPSAAPAPAPAPAPSAAPAPSPAPAPAAKSGGLDIGQLFTTLAAMGRLAQPAQQQEEKNEFEAGRSMDLEALFGHSKKTPASLEQWLALTGQVPRG